VISFERMKRQTTKWEKIFANHLFEKAQYKKNSKLNSKKNTPIRKKVKV